MSFPSQLSEDNNEVHYDIYSAHPGIDVEYILCSVWVLLICGSWLVSFMPTSLLGFVTENGKMQTTVQDAKRYELLSSSISSSQHGFIKAICQAWFKFSQFRVKKSFYLHFYILGAINGLAFIIVSYNYSETIMNMEHEGTTKYKFPIVCIFSTLLWEIHVVRRLFECIFITKFGTSTIHVSGYIVGIVHYLFVPVSLLLPCLRPVQYHRSM